MPVLFLSECLDFGGSAFGVSKSQNHSSPSVVLHEAAREVPDLEASVAKAALEISLPIVENGLHHYLETSCMVWIISHSQALGIEVQDFCVSEMTL